MALGKYFFARSHLNGMVLDVEGGVGLPGTNVIMWDQKPGFAGNENQLWYEDQSTGTIRSALCDLCLDLAGSSLVLNPFQMGNTNQQWRLDGNFIRNRIDHYTVLDIADHNVFAGARVCAWQQSGASNQLWDIQHQMATPFYIKSQMHGKVMDVRGEDRSPGAKIIMYDQWPQPRENQLWYEDNKGVVRSRLNDFAFDSSAGYEESVTLQPYDPNNPHQQWVMGQDGRVHRVGAPNDVLDIRGASSSDGAKIITYNYHGDANQRWIFQTINT